MRDTGILDRRLLMDPLEETSRCSFGTMLLRSWRVSSECNQATRQVHSFDCRRSRQFGLLRVRLRGCVAQIPGGHGGPWPSS